MIYGLLNTLISGLFFLIGIFLLEKAKNKEKISLLTISIALIVMLGLIIFDVLPEILETNNVYLIIPVLIGFLFLYIIDKYIPHHNHHHKNECSDHLEHVEHLNHIGVLTIVALGLHNMIEGLSLYSITVSSVTSGILMTISIGCHNIPLGFQIGNSLNKTKKSTYLIIFLVFSAVIGALIMMLFGNVSESLVSIILSLTLGMLVYIVIFELFEEVYYQLKKKEVLYGIIIGIVILYLTSLL